MNAKVMRPTVREKRVHASKECCNHPGTGDEQSCCGRHGGRGERCCGGRRGAR